MIVLHKLRLFCGELGILVCHIYKGQLFMCTCAIYIRMYVYSEKNLDMHTYIGTYNTYIHLHTHT